MTSESYLSLVVHSLISVIQSIHLSYLLCEVNSLMWCNVLSILSNVNRNFKNFTNMSSASEWWSEIPTEVRVCFLTDRQALLWQRWINSIKKLEKPGRSLHLFLHRLLIKQIYFLFHIVTRDLHILCINTHVFI